MMRDEVLGALDDPAEIADAELFSFGESAGQGQPGWVTKRPCPAGRELGCI